MTGTVHGTRLRHAEAGLGVAPEVSTVSNGVAAPRYKKGGRMYLPNQSSRALIEFKDIFNC